jgi:threonine dehydrogenase-like Zn-dependent dehydrogenase
MKALVYHGSKNVSVDTVADPKILDPKDAVVKITTTAICGSDLHLYNGYVPTVEEGDIFGHEFMGEIVEIGTEVKNLKVGDRVLVPFVISCGTCFFCKNNMQSLCDTTNQGNKLAEDMFGYAPAGLFGYTKLFGGYAGGQAQLARVPFADTTVFKIPQSPSELKDEQVLFLTDIFPTGYMAADNANIQQGDTVAIWGAGPVGQFAIRSAKLLGAGRVIVIDRIPERLAMAKEADAEVLNYEEDENVFETLKDMTKGRGPDSAIDAVGMEAHGQGDLNTIAYAYDKVKQTIVPGTDRITALRQVIHAVRKGGTVSIVGVYGGMADKFPTGIMMNKGLTIKQGQTPVQKYVGQLFKRVQEGEIDPSFVITHTLPLEEAPNAYEIFSEKKDNCIKVVLKPNG